MHSIISILAFIGLATAAPSLEKREEITVTICHSTNLGGGCMSPKIILQQQCLGYSGTAWDNTMRSINIPNGFRCRFWDSNNCNGDSTPDIYGPGTSNILGGMKDKSTSFKCYRN